jgi:hypothetical protein
VNFTRENVALEYALGAMNAVSSGALAANDEPGIYKALCRGVVEDDAYPIAWVAMMDQSDEVISITARSGRWAQGLEGRPEICSHFSKCRELALNAVRTGVAQTGHAPPPEALKSLFTLPHVIELAAVPIIIRGAPFGALIVGTSDSNGFGPLHLQFFTQLVGTTKSALSLHRAHAVEKKTRAEREELLQVFNATLERAIETLSEAMVSRDPYTVGHEQRVAEIAHQIGLRAGIGAEESRVLYLAGMIHDVGKIKVPLELLTKPTPLRPQEFAIIKEHAQASYDILSKIAWPWPLAEIAGQHHERMDGAGYPSGLKGSAILQSARILAVADVVESVMAARPYRGARGPGSAIDAITKSRGPHLDPVFVDAALQLFKEDVDWVYRLKSSN